MDPLTQPNPPPLNPSPAKAKSPSTMVCVIINLAAFPGLGTIMAKRRAGYIQATLMVAGFLLLMGFMSYFIYATFQLIKTQGSMEDLLAACRPYAWAGCSGLALTLVAWFWALFSSLSLIRQSKTQSPNA